MEGLLTTNINILFSTAPVFISAQIKVTNCAAAVSADLNGRLGKVE